MIEENYKKKFFGIIKILSFLTFLLIVVYQIVFLDCLFWTCPPARSFSVLDLGLPPELFPDNSIVNALHPTSDSFGAIDDGNMTVYWHNGHGLAVYNVHRFGTENKASRFLETLYRYRSRYKEHSQLAYRSTFANEFEIGCGLSEFGGYRCDLDSRYQEYVISFNATVGAEMSIEEYEEIIMFIDEQMIAHLQSDR